MSTADILSDALTLIECGWCQRAAARSATGEPCGPRDPHAVAWCISAAIYYGAAPTNFQSHFEAEKLVRASLGFDLDPQKRDSITIWNDDPARTVEDVLYALRDARASALRALMHAVPMPARTRQLFVPDGYNEPVIIGWRSRSNGFQPDDPEARPDTAHGIFMIVEANEDTPTIPPEPAEPEDDPT